MAPQPLARLTRCGVLSIDQGTVQFSPAFMAHVDHQRRTGRAPAWDLLALLEQALASWGEYAGDARQGARQLVTFLPRSARHIHLQPAAAFPVLDAFIAA